MTTVAVELPDKVLKALKEKIEREGKSLEEVIGEATLKQCSIEDPEVKAEFHLKLCEKYLREGDELLAKATMFRRLRSSGERLPKRLKR